MDAEIIAVGSELLTHSRAETNSLFIARILNESGIDVVRKVVVGDRARDIQIALRAAMKESEIVILTGGLGPTLDDITREMVSETLGRQLLLDSSILEGLESRYGQIGLKMTENNRRQAMVPEQAIPIDNPNGTAPGLFLEEGKILIFLLPGPPRELEPMMASAVMELIREHKRTSRQFFCHLRVAMEAESSVDSRVNPIYTSYPEIQTTILSSPGNIDLYFYWRGEADEKVAEEQLKELAERVSAELGDSVFTNREEELEEVVGRMLSSKGLTLATAESCTGGMIGKMITDVSGSSSFYLGGVVSYSDDLKIELLRVSEETLERFGAVSEEVASQMATGVRQRSGADLGLSVTGIAGPAGGTSDKPVGLIYVGLSNADQTCVAKTQFPGPRATVRLRTSRFALDRVRRSLL